MSVPLQLDELNRHMDSGFVKVLGLVHRPWACPVHREQLQ